LRRDPDAVLGEVRSYLETWHPYDTLAIRDLQGLLETKSFRPNEERLERFWKKLSQRLEYRRRRLEWAGE
jgi:hypothetical protein